MRKSFSIIVTLVFVSVSSQQARSAPLSDRVALVMGNSTYRLTSPLKNPVNDAAALAAALERLGFSVIRGFDLSLAAMDSRVSEFARKLGGSNLAFLYYAGHGMQLDGRNYLIPVDFDPSGKDALEERMIAMDKVLNDMTGGQRISIVILDACRDNPLANKVSDEINRGRYRSFSGDRGIHVIGKGLAEIKGSVGTLIAYATQPGNIAADGKGNHSPFADGLLQFIESPGLEIRDILTQVRKHVIQETKNSQIPWDHSSMVERVYLKQKQMRSAPPP